MRPVNSVFERAVKLVKRIEFNGVETLVFLRGDGVADSVPRWSPRADLLLSDRSPLRVVGVYLPGVSAHDLAEDIAAGVAP